MTTTAAPALAAYVEARLDTYLDELRALCAIECPTASKIGVDIAGAWVRHWIAARNWTVQDFPDGEVGDGFVATLRGDTPGGLRAMLVAHLDTVYPVGIAAERPIRQQGDKLIGAATADNKSGLLSGLYAMAALQDLGLLEPFDTLSMVCGGDEETDMRASEAMLRAIAPDYDLGLVLEAGRENGDIVGARKGSGNYRLEVFGKSAHAGVEPHKGAHAILALAQQIVALQLLNGMRPGVTLNVGVISGGSVPNSVPDYAEAVIDVRTNDPAHMAPVAEAISTIANTPYVHGVRAVLHGGWHHPPMARTPQIAALAGLAAACANELGFSVADAATGGISYANLLASLGLPVLDGLGPVGGLDHSPDEYILHSSIVPRTALLALLLLRAAETHSTSV